MSSPLPKPRLDESKVRCSQACSVNTSQGRKNLKSLFRPAISMSLPTVPEIMPLLAVMALASDRLIYFLESIQQSN